MILKRLVDYESIKNIHYCGKIHHTSGNRSWYINRCSKDSPFNNNPYTGIYVPWCLGGYGYIVSRYALQSIKDDNTYRDTIYEDLYISILLHKHDIYPCELKTNDYFIIY